MKGSFTPKQWIVAAYEKEICGEPMINALYTFR